MALGGGRRGKKKEAGMRKAENGEIMRRSYRSLVGASDTQFSEIGSLLGFKV